MGRRRATLQESKKPMRSQSSWARIISCAIAAIITLLVFLPSLRNGFVNYDDNLNFLENSHYRCLGIEQLRWMWTTFHMGPYQPLSWMTLGLDYVLWGMRPVGYHLTNIILHALAAGLFADVAMRLYRIARHDGQENHGESP